MATKSNAGKHQVGGWLTAEEKADFTKSMFLLGRRSVADVLRRLSKIHTWSKSRREAFVRLSDPEADPDCDWVFVRMDRETSIKLHMIAARWRLSPETVAESLIKTGVARPDTDPGDAVADLQFFQEMEVINTAVVSGLEKKIEALRSELGELKANTVSEDKKSK
jgi:hypothetical protein